MEDNVILSLQEEYLEIGSSLILEEFYTNILKLSYHILKYKQFYTTNYDELDEIVKDVCSSIVIRLINNKKTVIKDNPFAYLQRAILYASRPDNNKSVQFFPLEDYDGYPTCTDDMDPTFNEVVLDNSEETIHTFIVEYLKDEEDKDILYDSFYDCILTDKDYHKYIYKMKLKYMKAKFCRMMEAFEEHLRRSL